MTAARGESAVSFGSFTSPRLSCGLPSTSMMRPRVALPTGTEIGAPVACHRQPALQTFRGAHGDGANDAVAELLLHFEREIHVLQLQSLVDLRDGSRGNATSMTAPMICVILPSASCHDFFPQTAAAPPTISESSFVIAAWRALL